MIPSISSLETEEDFNDVADQLLETLGKPQAPAEPDLLDQLIAEAKATVQAKRRTPGQVVPSEPDLASWIDTAYIFVLREETCRCGRVWPAAEGIFIERQPRNVNVSRPRHLIRTDPRSLTTVLPRKRETRQVAIDVCPVCALTLGF